ncbi:putative arginine decarboxylase [Helianthus annuus]|nr:putative arginine decarboxylase [Helianthus annuus]KAJ0755775.1 putative arginine decarboxylase [Helianthus annuus]KAJ0759555.1 putative arginine decarboxylase [Helianthus annuus]KAJ0816973.1 putative arginine decarboxylase [Helianthus annuus]
MELLLAMSCLCKGSSESLLICNGFKDVEYVELASIARKLSLNTVIVLEQEEELDSVIDDSMKLGVRPVVGVRVKLRTKHSGHFGATSHLGRKGISGLLRRKSFVYLRRSCLRMVLVKLRRFTASWRLSCRESGRALVSHHSVLIFEAVSSSKYTVPTMSSFDVQGFVEQLPEDAHSDYNNLSQSAVKGDYEAGLACGYVSRAKNERVGSSRVTWVVRVEKSDYLFLTSCFQLLTPQSNPYSHINIQFSSKIYEFYSIILPGLTSNIW